MANISDLTIGVALSLLYETDLKQNRVFQTDTQGRTAMREILFRGKTEDGRWIYGYLFILGNGSEYEETYILGDIDHRDSIYDIWKNAEKVIPETVGQWTGLYDKNGVKIFEGDIEELPGWIVTHCGTNGTEDCGMQVGWYIQRDNFESWTELIASKVHTVIGNIHDNPELL